MKKEVLISKIENGELKSFGFMALARVYKYLYYNDEARSLVFSSVPLKEYVIMTNPNNWMYDPRKDELFVYLEMKILEACGAFKNKNKFKK